MKIEIEASWADVDSLLYGSDLVIAGDIYAGIVAASAKRPMPPANNTTSDAMRAIAERIIGQLPPRETKP